MANSPRTEGLNAGGSLPRRALLAIREALLLTRGEIDLDPRVNLSLVQRFLVTNLRVVFLIFRIEVYRRVELHAQALTMKTLLTLVPALLVVFTFMRFFDGGLENANLDIIEELVGYLSGSAALQEQIWTYISVSNVHQAEISLFTLGVLVVTITSLLNHVESSFNTLFGVTAQRPLGVRLLTYWALLTVGPLLLLTSIILTAALQTSGFVQQIESFGAVGRLTINATPLAISWFAFALLYFTVPNTRVRIVPAVLAALVAGSFWNVAKYSFAWYARSNVTVQDIYGSLAAFPMFIIWVYISWVLILGGAQLCFAFQHANTYRPDAEVEVASFADLERAGCRIFFAVARNFAAGHGPTRVDAIAPELGFSVNVLRQAIEGLRCGGLVTEEIGGGLNPARDLDTVTIEDLLAALRGTATDSTGHPTDGQDWKGYFDDLLGQLHSERRRLTGTTTFRDLVLRFDDQRLDDQLVDESSEDQSKKRR